MLDESASKDLARKLLMDGVEFHHAENYDPAAVEMFWDQMDSLTFPDQEQLKRQLRVFDRILSEGRNEEDKEEGE